MTPLENRIDEWQKKIPVFAEATRGVNIRSLGEELGELCEAALEGTDELFYKEAADLAITLIGMLALEGQSLQTWIETKMDRNEARIEKIIEKQAAKQKGVE